MPNQEIAEELIVLNERRNKILSSIALAKDGLKKCKKRSGAAAHKRSWYFEDQIKKFQLQLDAVDTEILQLQASPD